MDSIGKGPNFEFVTIEISSTLMLDATTIDLSRNVKRCKLSLNGRKLSFEEVMTMMASGNEALINAMINVLTSFAAVYWECIPVTASKFESTEFEFVVIRAAGLARRKVDVGPYIEKFQELGGPMKVIAFESLSKDATLVVPCPVSLRMERFPQFYSHLASFLKRWKEDPEDAMHRNQVTLLWKTVGSSMLNRIAEETRSNRPLWLSTSGHGVAWLHVRIDEFPKYYEFPFYRDLYLKKQPTKIWFFLKILCVNATHH